MASLKLSLVFVGLLATLLGAAQDEYTPETGFYRFQLPAGWESQASESALQLAREGVSLSILQLPAAEAERLIARAFAELEIAPGALINSLDAPLPNGTWKQQIYAKDTRLNIGLAQARGEQALVIIINGEQSAIQKLNPQILQILTSISFGEARQPDYVISSAFQESEVSFGSPPYVLGATLSLPAGEGPFPAVVIVHGSGPQSRDGTLGPLTAYRDIARGLASMGIAALRYDKRSFSHAAEIKIDATFTVDDETTDDALSASAFLRGHEAIDPNGIFVLGHSQGGSLTPRILSRDDRLAGGILMAAATRPFSRLLRDQLNYIGQVNPAIMEAPTVAGLQVIADAFATVAGGASYVDAFAEQATYFESLEHIDPLGMARRLRQPLLILQGERDYQVTMEDYGAWQEAFGEDGRFTLASYPDLNHQFMSQGDLSRLAIPQDYEIRAAVDAAVIEDIANWIARIYGSGSASEG